MHSIHLQCCRTLLTEACQGGIKKLRAFSDADTPTVLNMQAVTGLTSISQGRRMACTPFAILAYHNAGTLRILSIRPATEAEWLALLYNDTETLAVFSSLASLAVKVTDMSYTTTWSAIKNVEPFPVLSKLSVSGYPFSDDVLFRGNGVTMQNLRLPLCAFSRNVLGRFCIFKRSGVNQMGVIHIGQVMMSDIAQLIERVDVPIGEQFYCLFGVAKALKVKCEKTGALLCRAISTAPITATLRYLELSNVARDMVFVITVISKFPTLASLTCHIRGLGASIESIPVRNRPSILCAMYYPLSVNFRKLRVPYAANASADVIARVAMLIAVLCPNLMYVDISPELRKDFSREISWGQCRRSLKPFAASIGRLMFSQ
ncbi:hypothetical protein GGI03_001974 [Coemansia sp. RSA 2337]|nr:hypothetical protein GGI03_001974 [Coemansia sp. RSA 2337]